MTNPILKFGLIILIQILKCLFASFLVVRGISLNASVQKAFPFTFRNVLLLALIFYGVGQLLGAYHMNFDSLLKPH